VCVVEFGALLLPKLVGIAAGLLWTLEEEERGEGGQRGGVPSMSNGMWSVALGAAAPAAERTCSALSSSRSSFNNLVNQTCPPHVLLLLLLLDAYFLLLRV